MARSFNLPNTGQVRALETAAPLAADKLDRSPSVFKRVGTAMFLLMCGAVLSGVIVSRVLYCEVIR